MPNLYVPDPRNRTEGDVLEWWSALDPGTRQVFLQAVWEMEGCETPDDLEPHQRNPRFNSKRTLVDLWPV